MKGTVSLCSCGTPTSKRTQFGPHTPHLLRFPQEHFISFDLCVKSVCLLKFLSLRREFSPAIGFLTRAAHHPAHILGTLAVDTNETWDERGAPALYTGR